MPVLATDRQCQSCFACCIHLGIKELHKYSGQSCRKLDGKDPLRRCSVYDKRPIACAEYRCAWLSGLGPNNGRPSDSGLLVTIYPPHASGTCSATLTILDAKKCGNLNEGPLYEFLDQLVNIGADSIRIIHQNKRDLLHIIDNKIYKGHILPPDKGEYEALNFAAEEPPIGTIKQIEREETNSGLG